MSWSDLTLGMYPGMPVWPGNKPFERVVKTNDDRESESYISRISLSTHTGTHVDAPLHFIENGRNITEIDLELLVGPCKVVEIESDNKLIRKDDLKGKVKQGDTRLLVKTKNIEIIHDNKFHKDFTAFSVEAINWLLARGIKLLGIDYFSIAPFENSARVHRAFLQQNDTLALEGIDLSQIEPGEYQLICLPMKIEGAGGAPARVLLKEIK